MANRSDVALLLSRATFNIFPDQVAQLADMDWERVLTVVVDKASPPAPPVPPLANRFQSSEYNDFQLMIEFEFTHLYSPGSGLGDRMLWFWHNLVTSSWDKVFLTGLLLRQHQLMATHALGNFRQLMYDISTDAAMVLYLDLNYSTAHSPNENYAREVMELFTLGLGNYTQEDVRAGAYAFTGRYLNFYPQNVGASYDPSQIKVRFNPDFAYKGSLKFLGTTLEMDGSENQYRKIIDTILSFSPAPGRYPCSEYIVTRLFRHFVHPGPDAATVANLASIFRNNDYEIMPVLSAMFRHPDFLNSRGARPRYPMEFLTAMTSALGLDVSNSPEQGFFLSACGQQPFNPPNVAGWPQDNRWLSAGQLVARANFALRFMDSFARGVVRKISKTSDPVAAAVTALGLYQVSQETLNSMNQAAMAISDPRARARLLLVLGLLSPEFSLN